MLADLRAVPSYFISFFLQPSRSFRKYNRDKLRADLVAGLTVSIILLPQAIAYALIAELPPAMGLFTAVVGATVAALWGSSSQVHTGRILTEKELVNSNQVFFTATGITDGPLLAGVHYRGNRAETDFLVLRGETGTRRTIFAEHLVE